MTDIELCFYCREPRVEATGNLVLDSRTPLCGLHLQAWHDLLDACDAMDEEQKQRAAEWAKEKAEREAVRKKARRSPCR